MRTVKKDDGLNGPPIQKMGPPEGQKHHLHMISFVCGDGGNYDVELCTVLVLLVKFMFSEKATKNYEIFTVF